MAQNQHVRFFIISIDIAPNFFKLLLFMIPETQFKLTGCSKSA
jgi:hypothetical protein